METVYKKICKYCNKDFESVARNQRYCSTDCCSKAQEVNKKKQKTRKRKRKEYDANKEINRALSQSYAVCEKVFELFKIPKKCNCQAYGFDDECSGEMERHHKDGNPFNNSPDNLEYMCRRHHAKADDLHANVNVVTTYAKAIDEAGFEDDDVKHEKMIEYFMKVVNS